MGPLLQQGNVIFYHPLDGQTEWVESKVWTKASGDFTAAEVGGGLSREGTGAGLSGLSADYASAAGATKVAFCGWFRRPSAPAAFASDSAPLADAAALAVGIPEGDSVSLTDTVGVGKLESDSVPLADAAVFVVGAGVSDDITVSDTMAVFVGVFGAVVSGELVLSDDLVASAGVPEADSVSLADAVTVTVHHLPPPQAFDPAGDRAYMMAMGAPASPLGGLT